MAWFDQDKDLNIENTAPKEEVMEALTISQTQAKDLAKRFGYDTTYNDEGDLEFIINNTGMSDADFKEQFLDMWIGGSLAKQDLEQRRKVKNSSYALMDEIFGIATLTLNAYADEALGIGFIDQPIDITISDKNIEGMVKAILERNDVFNRARAHIRSLCKWGDLGVQIIPKHSSKDPLDISLKFTTPEEWEAFFIERGPLPLGYKLTPKYENKASQFATQEKERILQPWEFVQYSVPDEESAPYGRSLLEAMRTSFDQLSTIEALLALSRVSRVERLIVRVPTGNTNNPTQALQKMNVMASNLKNVIFNNKKGNKSHARTPSMQDVLFFPSDEGFDIDRLPSGSGVELSSTDDVEFFRDNVLMMTGLPKGYLLADDTTDRYHALTAQDLKFARQLIPYQDAYVKGLTKLCTVLAGYCGANLATTKVKVVMKRPIQMSDQLLDNYEAISRSAVELIDNFKRAGTTYDSEGNEKEPKVPENIYLKLMSELGMQDEIIEIFSEGLDSEDDPRIGTDVGGDAFKKGVISDYLQERKDRNSIKCTSHEIMKSDRALFEYFKTNGLNILKESLIKDNKILLEIPTITKNGKWSK